VCQISFWLPHTEGLTYTCSAKRGPATFRVWAMPLQEGGEGIAHGVKHR